MKTIYKLLPDPDEILQTTPVLGHTNVVDDNFPGKIPDSDNAKLLLQLESQRFVDFSPEILTNDQILKASLSEQSISGNNLHVLLHIATRVADLISRPNNICTSGNFRNSLDIFIERISRCLYLKHLYEIFLSEKPQTLQEAYFSIRNGDRGYCSSKIRTDMWDCAEFHARCLESESSGIPLQEQFGGPLDSDVTAAVISAFVSYPDVGELRSTADQYRVENRRRVNIMRKWLQAYFADSILSNSDSDAPESCLNEDHSQWLQRCDQFFSDPKTIFFLSQPNTEGWYNVPKLRGVDYRFSEGIWHMIPSK